MIFAIRNPQMNALRSGLIALACLGQVHAQMILLSADRCVTASGWAQGNGGAPGNAGAYVSYSDVQGSTASVGTFNGSVNGSADATDVVPAAWNGQMSISPHHAGSWASQTSLIGPDVISVTGAVHADEGGYGFNYPASSGSALSSATSIFEVDFLVTTPVTYELNWTSPWDRFHADSAYDPIYDFSLTSTTLGTLLSLADFQSASYSPRTGLLQPGDYTLRLDATAATMGDPLGDVANASYGISFAMVPESVSTFLALGLAFAGLVVLRRRTARIRRCCWP